MGQRKIWEKLLSTERPGAGKAPGNPERTAFQQDYDRIVFTSAFRRLKYKTQVFPLSKSDYVRTRLTHSLEASCVGRSLGCLAHAGRKFEDSLNYNKEISSTVPTKIQKLYKVEQMCRDENLNDTDRKSRRQELSNPILLELKEYLDEQAPKQIHGTPIHKAIGYHSIGGLNS